MTNNISISNEFIDDRNTLTSEDKLIIIFEKDLKFASILMRTCHKMQFKAIVVTNGLFDMHLCDIYSPDGIIVDSNHPLQEGQKIIDLLKAHPKTSNIPIFFLNNNESNIISLNNKENRNIPNGDNLEFELAKFIGFSKKKLKNILIFEQSKKASNSLMNLVNPDTTVLNRVTSEKDVLNELKNSNFDLMIVCLPIEGFNPNIFFENLRNSSEKSLKMPPIIIYSDKELTYENWDILSKYATNIIVNSTKSPAILLDEVTLFLEQTLYEINIADKNSLIDDRRKRIASRKILLIDEDIKYSFYLSKILDKFKLEISTAINPNEALEKLKNQTDFDMIMVDLDNSKGYDFIKNIKSQEKFADLPIIAISTQQNDGVKSKCFKAGANNLLAKPLDVDDLLTIFNILIFN